MKTSHVLLIAATGLGLIFSTGCGRKEASTADGTTSGASTAKAPANQPATSPNNAGTAANTPTAASGRQVEITGNDLMKFSINEIRAKPGESLTVTLSNVGTMPKFSMGHNWVLLKAGANVDTFITEAATAPTTDYIPQARKGDILAHTKLLGPKEKDSVTFQAPKEAGRYTFLCSFPGHYQVGMKGELIVE